MLRSIPDNDTAFAACAIHDVTEARPIPKGAQVGIEDFDPCGDSEGLFIVSYRDRIYLASPDELTLRPQRKR